MSGKVKLSPAQQAFLETLRAHGLFVRNKRAAYLRPLVKAALVDVRQDEAGFYCAITEAGRQLLQENGNG